MSFKLLKSRRSAPIAAIICVLATFAAARVCLAADDPWPSYELVANGDFEAGNLVPNKKANGYGNYQEGLTGSSPYIPGWTLANCVKAKANGVYIPSGLPIGTYAICLKTNSGSPSSFYQDVTVPAPGVYRISFQWVARGKSYNKETVTVSFSQVVDGEVPTENVLTTFAATTYASLTTYHRTIDVKAAGTYRLRFSGTSSVDSSTAFDNVSVRKIDNLLENGFFDSGTASAYPYYSTGAGHSNPGWTVNAKCGLDPASGTWVAKGRDVGAYAMFIQSDAGIDGFAYQDVTIATPGLYTLAFDYAGRPECLGQTAKIYFGKIGGDKADVTEDDLLDTLSPASDAFVPYSRPVAVLSAGTYRLKFFGSSSADKATAYDNVRLFATEELVTNGEFEEGSFSVSQPWGAYAYFANYSNPGWEVNSPSWVGLGCPFGTWIAAGLEVGKYAMFIQTKPDSGDVKAWQDVAVSAPGTYRVALNYVARPKEVNTDHSGQTIKISFGQLVDGAIANDLINDQFMTTTSSELTPYEKYITVETVGTYRILFTAQQSTKDCATAIDCVSVRRQTEYCFWTGGGDGTTISDPANWGRTVLSPVDDLCFTNDTALAVSVPADFTASSLNFFGTGSVTVNGSGAGGDAAKTLTIGKIVSTSSAANTFNCPVAFTTDYNVNSAGPVEFPNGVTAAGWGAVDGAGGLRLAGTSFTFTADTVTISGNATLAAGAKLSAKNLTGASGQTLTIESGARVELSGNLVTGEGANARLGVAMADGAELSVTNGTVYVWSSIFTTTRQYGTVWANGLVLDVRNNDLGFYAKRINLGSGGISFNGSTKTVHMDIGLGGAVGTYVFGAYADWTWNDGGHADCYFYQNNVKFDTLDCIDGETPRTITIAKAFNNTAAKLYKLNPGTLVLAAPQYFAGGTFLEGGRIVVSAERGAGTGPATLASGTTLEVVEGGTLGNSAITVESGATLAFANGSGLAGPVTATGAVTVAGNVSFVGGASIALAEGGSLAFGEGAKISVGPDVEEGTLITGSGLTAAQLAEHFDTPYGAVRLNDAGDVVYVNAFEWTTALAGEDTYFKYGVAAAASVLVDATCDDTGIARYSENNDDTRPSATTSCSVLTDGDVHLVGRAVNYQKIYALVSGTVEWTFQPADIAEIAVFSRWGDGGRDGVVVESVYVKGDGSDEWSQIMVVPVSVGTGDNASSAGGICAVLRRVDGAPLARGVTGLKIVFPTGQDNSGAGYAEVAAYASAPASRSYTWSNATGNRLFSDVGNWTDGATGAAAGPAGSTFEPTRFAALAFPASADVVVDKSATVCSVALNSGVVLGNPDATTTNTLTFCKLSNAGTGTATVSCGAEFVAGYEVSLQGPVDFAGGATAWSLGISLDASTSEIEHTFRGNITFRDSLGIPNEAPTWAVPSGSRLVAAGLEKKKGLNGHVNGSPAMRIENGGSARFGYVTVGRDNVYLSVQGEMDVDGIYSVRSVYNNNGNFEGNFGYAGDEAFAGSVIRAGGLLRPSDSINSYDACVYPANLYIGGQGICQATAHNGIKFVGCAKKVYATADFTIRGPDASSGLLALEADAEFDTQGHTVTWTSGISGAATLTKKGEGTLVMSPAAGTSAFTGSVVVNGGTLAISNDVLTATSISLGEGTVIAVGANRTVPAAGVVAASGAVRVVVTGNMAEAQPGDEYPLFANCTAETFARLRIDSSNLQSLSRKYGAFLRRNGDGAVSMVITKRGLTVYLK